MANKRLLFKASSDVALCNAVEIHINGGATKKAQLYRDYESAHKELGIESAKMCRTEFYALLKDVYDPVAAAFASGEYAKAKKMLRSVNQRFQVDGYLSRMESDAIHSPIGLLHPTTFAYVGMPLDYFSMDVSTRGIAAHVTDGFGKGERAEQVIRLLQNALLPVTDDPERYGTKNKNPFFGNAQLSANDPGSAFCNLMVLEFMCEFQINQVIEKTAQPWLRPFIERFFWSFVTLFLCKLPGYFPNAKSEVDRVSRASALATLTVWEYEVLVKRFINDTYHFRPHKGLFGKTPIEKLHEELYREDSPIVRTLPHNYKVMSTYCIKMPRQRSIQEHKGIQIDNRMYQDGKITGSIYRWLKKYNRSAKVDVFIDHNDFSYIRIRDPRNNNLVALPFSCMECGHKHDDLEDIGISSERERVLQELALMSSEQIIANAIARKKKMIREAKEKRRTPKSPAKKIDELTEDDFFHALGQPPRSSMLRSESVEEAEVSDVRARHDSPVSGDQEDSFDLRY